MMSLIVGLMTEKVVNKCKNLGIGYIYLLKEKTKESIYESYC